MRAALALAASLVLAPMPSPAAPAAARIDCKITAPARAVSGAPVRLRFTLTNRGPSAARVLTWNTPWEGWFAPYVVVRRDGTELPYRGPTAKRGNPDASEYLHIGAGRSRSVTVDLAQPFDLGAPGPVTVQARLRLHDVVAGDGRVPRPREHMQPQDVSCNTIAFDILPAAPR